MRKTDMAKKLVRGVINNFGANRAALRRDSRHAKSARRDFAQGLHGTMKDPEFAARTEKAKARSETRWTVRRWNATSRNSSPSTSR